MRFVCVEMYRHNFFRFSHLHVILLTDSSPTFLLRKTFCSRTMPQPALLSCVNHMACACDDRVSILLYAIVG